jgi:hypothetical protein
MGSSDIRHSEEELERRDKLEATGYGLDELARGVATFLISSRGKFILPANQIVVPGAPGFIWNVKIAMPLATHVRVLDSYYDTDLRCDGRSTRY